jgi:hypothetical protein
LVLLEWSFQRTVWNKPSKNVRSCSSICLAVYFTEEQSNVNPLNST